MTDLKPFTEPNQFVDCDHRAVQEYARANCGHQQDPIQKAVALYYSIRDGFRYNPWGMAARPEDFKASAVLLRERRRGGHCIDKANVLAACARAVGIPSRLHFANVRNHIATEELERKLGTSLLVFHGYVELFLHQRWVAATPAFNKELCQHLGVAPLEFNGEEDSIFQEYDHAGGRFMEYVHDYGAFSTIPYQLMTAEWKKHYPVLAENDGRWPSRD